MKKIAGKTTLFLMVSALILLGAGFSSQEASLKTNDPIESGLASFFNDADSRKTLQVRTTKLVKLDSISVKNGSDKKAGKHLQAFFK
jgi:hypothetical protein